MKERKKMSIEEFVIVVDAFVCRCCCCCCWCCIYHLLVVPREPMNTDRSLHLMKGLLVGLLVVVVGLLFSLLMRFLLASSRKKSIALIDLGDNNTKIWRASVSNSLMGITQ